jgi:hypothetical protein
MGLIESRKHAIPDASANVPEQKAIQKLARFGISHQETPKPEVGVEKPT